MPKKSLIDYIKKQLKKGYDVSSIRNVLLKYGYSGSEIDDAIGSTTIRHEIHLSRTSVFVVVLILVFLTGIVLFLRYKPVQTPSNLLDLNLEPIATNVAPGQSIAFIKELSNLGSAKRYDVVIKQEIIDPLTNEIVTQKIETRAIETFGSTQTKMLIPDDTKTGDYILRAIVEYENKKAVATLPVKIARAAKKETCFDGVKNQDEENIDCGGACNPCNGQAKECNDNNQCTDDLVENGICSNKPIEPCCGNNACESQENDDCLADCPKAAEPSFPALPEDLDEIKEAARANPLKALQQCSAIEVPDLKDECISSIGGVQRDKSYCARISNARIKDLCYSGIAKSSNDNSICRDISADSRKDSCYMTFVLDNKDYSVCGSIINNHLRQSCESLKQLNELSRASQEPQ
ncbi:hypothetical protein HYV80_06530 [Candidatus Woesearchaeota archaeon]|nr:hypothetical protein [Candidatus Woesearchaeota archaeon]